MLIDLHRKHLNLQRRNVNREVSIHKRLPFQSTSAALGDLLAGSITSPSNAAIRAEEFEGLKRCLADMSELDREVLVLRHMEQLSESESAIRELASKTAIEPSHEIDRPGDFEIVREISRGGMGIVYEARHDYVDIAINHLEQLRAANPQSADYRYLLALCLRDKSNRTVFFDRSTSPRSLAASLLQELASEFPANPIFRFELSETYRMINHDQLAPEHVERAIEQLLTAQEISEQLVAEQGQVASYRIQLAHSRSIRTTTESFHPMRRLAFVTVRNQAILRQFQTTPELARGSRGHPLSRRICRPPSNSSLRCSRMIAIPTAS